VIRCIHCLNSGMWPNEVCPRCLELLADLGEEAYVPPPPRPTRRASAPQPRPEPVRPFAPTAEDDAAYRDLLSRRSFEPFHRVRPKQLPSHARDLWGKAIDAEKRRPKP
jgi:hypothetical protein